jgi:hypothetical protein
MRENIVRQTIVDAISEINVAFAFKTREAGEFRRVPTQRLVQMHHVFAANKNVSAARHKMHRNVYLIEPR